LASAASVQPASGSNSKISFFIATITIGLTIITGVFLASYLGKLTAKFKKPVGEKAGIPSAAPAEPTVFPLLPTQFPSQPESTPSGNFENITDLSKSFESTTGATATSEGSGTY
jgi:hypothetical protein